MAAAITFLKLNGKSLTEHTDVLYDVMIAIAQRRLDRPGLATLLRAFCGPT